jgi:hypothetical protein
MWVGLGHHVGHRVLVVMVGLTSPLPSTHCAPPTAHRPLPVGQARAPCQAPCTLGHGRPDNPRRLSSLTSPLPSAHCAPPTTHYPPPTLQFSWARRSTSVQFIRGWQTGRPLSVAPGCRLTVSPFRPPPSSVGFVRDRCWTRTVNPANKNQRNSAPRSDLWREKWVFR